MIQILASLLLLSVTLFANNGEAIYQKHCAACHTLSTEKSPDMKAPTFPMISMRLKKMVGDKEKVVTFVDDYIQNPSQEKGHCMPMAFKRFGLMPAIGKAMSSEDRLAVSTWLYEHFEGSWDKSMDGKKCESKNTMKCGQGKCGSMQNPKMKCGAGKCGSVKIPTH